MYVLIECLKEMKKVDFKLSSSGENVAQGVGVVEIQSDVESKTPPTDQSE